MVLIRKKENLIASHSTKWNFPDLNSGMSNYELLNNVPPNVSLQRSTNVVSDTQLSPGFSPNLLQQQLSPNQRAPFSPQSNQSIGYQSFNTNNGQNQVRFQHVSTRSYYFSVFLFFTKTISRT